MNEGRIIFNLDHYLQERKIPKLRLSKNSGVDYRTVLKYCKGDISRTDLDILARLCYALKCNVDDIIKYVGDGCDSSESK